MNEPISLNDTTRQNYLREMGVAVFFPRRPLPGAAASRRYQTDEDASAGRVGTDHAPVDSIDTGLSGQLPGKAERNQQPVDLAGLKDSLSPGQPAGRLVDADTHATPPGSVQTETAVGKSDALEFRFTWLRPDERLCVIAGHSTAALPAGLRQMLQRILAALSPRYRELPLEGEVFQWPLDPAMPGDGDAARQVVRAFLRRRHGPSPPRFMLVLMDGTPDWLFPADAGTIAAESLQLVTMPGESQRVLRVPALETMARDASVKRPAWQAMQSLIGPLADHVRD